MNDEELKQELLAMKRPDVMSFGDTLEVYTADILAWHTRKLKEAVLEARIAEQQRYLEMLKTGKWRSFATEVTERLAELEKEVK